MDLPLVRQNKYFSTNDPLATRNTDTVEKIYSEGLEKEETLQHPYSDESNMTRLEDEAFLEEWSKNWNPNLGQ